MSKREMGEHEIFLIVDNVDPKTKFDFLQNCGDVSAAVQKGVSLACWVLTMDMM
jgi:hypothetical protein